MYSFNQLIKNGQLCVNAYGNFYLYCIILYKGNIIVLNWFSFTSSKHFLIVRHGDIIIYLKVSFGV